MDAQPSATSPANSSPPFATSPAASTGAHGPWATPWLRWVVYVAVVVVALACGAVAATAATLVALGDEARDRYIVTVLLTDDVAAEQKTAVQAALSRLYPTAPVQLQSREQTRESLRELYEGQPGSDETPESFRVELAGTSIDCGALVPVEKRPGVRMIIVVQPPAKGHPNALVLECP